MTKWTRRSAIAATAASLALVDSGARAHERNGMTWYVNSPGRRTELQLNWNRQSGAMHYCAFLYPRGRNSGRKIVDWSRLGLVTKIQETFQLREVVSSFPTGFDHAASERTLGEDVYSMVVGKKRENRARYEQLSLTFRAREGGRLVRLDLRAYEDGVAFRYALPESHPFHHSMTEEQTEFNIGLGGTHWGQPYDFYTMYHPSYETVYDARPMGTPAPQSDGTGWGFPSLFETHGAYVLLHESGLNASFHGSHLKAEAPNGIYSIAAPMQVEARGFGASFPASTLPWAMPWRVLILGDDLADIVESNLVFHLAEPSRIADTSWIKPGIAAWNWLSDHESGRDQAKLRGYIDLAAEMGWPYALIDANWNLSGENAMEALVAYANTKGVGLTFWYNSGGRHNVVTEEPRNRLDDRDRRRAEFARLQALGVRGVKVDFLQSDKQDIIRLYLDILEDAAEHRLLVDFHGCTIPRGWERTWPNLLTMEAVRGAEFYSFPSQPDYGEIAPRQNTIHPFLRNVIGSMDYTPVLFSQFEVRRRTTNAHEAALAVIFESGLLHMADSPAGYRAVPPDYKAYLREVPTVWDETRLLAGAPGAHVVLARRNGARWWVAGINGENIEKTITLDLSGLAGLAGDGLVLFDGDGFASRPRNAHEGRAYRARMAPFGGFVLAFSG